MQHKCGWISKLWLKQTKNEWICDIKLWFWIHLHLLFLLYFLYFFVLLVLMTSSFLLLAFSPLYIPKRIIKILLLRNSKRMQLKQQIKKSGRSFSWTDFIKNIAGALDRPKAIIGLFEFFKVLIGQYFGRD